MIFTLEGIATAHRREAMRVSKQVSSQRLPQSCAGSARYVPQGHESNTLAKTHAP
jgi:hypothetical protein